MATSAAVAYVPLSTTPSLAVMNLTLARNLKQFQQGSSGEETESYRDTDSAEDTEGAEEEEEEKEDEKAEEARPVKRQRKSGDKGKGKGKEVAGDASTSHPPTNKAKTCCPSSTRKSAPKLPKQTIHLRLLRETQTPTYKLTLCPLNPQPAAQPAQPPRLPQPPQLPQPYRLRSHTVRTTPPRPIAPQPANEKPKPWSASLHALSPDGPRETWARLFPNELPLGEYGGEPTGWMAKMMWKDGRWVERGPEEVYVERFLGDATVMAEWREAVKRAQEKRLADWLGLLEEGDEGEGEKGEAEAGSSSVRLML